MSLYDANRNTSKEPAYSGATTNYPNHMQRPMMFNQVGGQHKFVGRRYEESYVFSTHEEVVNSITPLKPTVSTEKADDGRSPKSHHPDVSSRTKGSLGPEGLLKDKSPPLRNHQYYNNTNDHGKYNRLSSNDDKSDEDNYKGDAKPKEIKRNGYAPPAKYTTPYKLNNETPNSINNNVSVPPKVEKNPQVKTRIGDPDFPKTNMKKIPTDYNNASPKMGQGYPEVIDSSEARRRYSGGPSTRDGQYGREMYNGLIIDCKEAAKKYNGVFVPK